MGAAEFYSQPQRPPPELYVHPSRELTVPAAAVVPDDDHRLQAIVTQMLKVMHAHRGVGLAAPQVGVSLRIVVIDTVSVDQLPEVLVNPVWTVNFAFLHGPSNVDVEGCLSVPGELYKVPRHAVIDLVYQDLRGNIHERHGISDFAARVIQHECDHLAGKLINDGRFRRFGGGL